MELEVRDVLPILEERGGRLVAGREGLSRCVKYFDMLEQPDIKPWLRPDLLMITTGYAIRNDKDALLRLIGDLNEGHVAALVIKTRFFDVFPEEAVQYCEQLGFPLIILDNNVSFVEITNPLMEAIINAKNDMDLVARFQASDQGERELNMYLFLDLISGSQEKWNEIEYRLRSLRWPAIPVRVVAIRVLWNSDRKLLRKEEMEQVYRSVKVYLGTSQIGSIVIVQEEEVICICENRRGGKTGEGADDAEKEKAVFAEIWKRLENHFRVKAVVGISGAVDHYHDIAQAYGDVQDALKIGMICGGEGGVYRIDDLRHEQTYLHMSRESFWQDYVKKRLIGLEQYDYENDLNLLETLEMLVKYLGSRKMAAEKLFLHRNTMSYRIKKIESLTGMSLLDGEDLLQLGIALKIRKYL